MCEPTAKNTVCQKIVVFYVEAIGSMITTLLMLTILLCVGSYLPTDRDKITTVVYIIFVHIY